MKKFLLCMLVLCMACTPLFGASDTEETPKMDTISEKTAAAGVTVDGVLLKDGVIAVSAVPDDSVDADALADADLGDVSVSSGVVSLDADVVAAAEMADADHGDVAWTSGVAAVENVQDDIIVKADLADEDWGDVSVSSGVVSLDADTVVYASELPAFVIAAGANTACNTTCGIANCIAGINDGAGYVACDGATADTCLCDGATA